MTKREMAIDEVKKNLDEVAIYFKFGIPTITELTQSGNVSVIAINNDKPQGSGIYQNPIIKALEIEEETKEFINEQLMYINMLAKEYKSIIVYRYLKNISINKIQHYVEFEYYSKNKLYAMHDEALEMIAVLNNKINYTLKDYINFKTSKKKE